MSALPEGLINLDAIPSETRWILVCGDEGRLSIWSRAGMTGADFARQLREVADSFDVGGSARRVE